MGRQAVNVLVQAIEGTGGESLIVDIGFEIRKRRSTSLASPGFG